MGRKKKRGQEEPARIFCWYCDRDFHDESVLVTHQKNKHFKCMFCHKRLLSLSGLVIHCQQLHKETVEKVPNSIEGRDSLDVAVYGMEGVPEQEEEAAKKYRAEGGAMGGSSQSHPGYGSNVYPYRTIRATNAPSDSLAPGGVLGPGAAVHPHQGRPPPQGGPYLSSPPTMSQPPPQQPPPHYSGYYAASYPPQGPPQGPYPPQMSQHWHGHPMPGAPVPHYQNPHHPHPHYGGGPYPPPPYQHGPGPGLSSPYGAWQPVPPYGAGPGMGGAAPGMGGPGPGMGGPGPGMGGPGPGPPQGHPQGAPIDVGHGMPPHGELTSQHYSMQGPPRELHQGPSPPLPREPSASTSQPPAQREPRYGSEAEQIEQQGVPTDLRLKTETTPTEQRPPGAEKLEHTVINGGQPSLEEMQQPPPPPPPPSETPLTTTPLHEPQSAPTSTTVTQSSPHFTTHPTVTVANMNLVFPYADVSMEEMRANLPRYQPPRTIENKG